MSTPTPKTKPIDLSKCEVGQRVKLRNGEIQFIASIKKEDTHQGKVVKINSDSWRWRDGSRNINRADPLDIVALLPLPKKAGKPGKPGKKKVDNYNLDKLRRLIADFEAGRDVFTKEINRLKGLLKP